jgi:hypothetical protein
MKINGNLLFNGDGQTQNLIIETLAADPTPLGKGHEYFNTISNALRVYNGTIWENASGVDTLDELADVTITTPSAGETIIHDGSVFVNRKTYHLYSSSAPATSHTVTHDTGQKYCNVTVVDANDEVMIPQSVVFSSATGLVVTFNEAVHCKVVVMGISSASSGGGGVVRTNDTYWQSYINDASEYVYSWDGTKWNHPQNGTFNDMGLKVATSGPNVGWEVGYRPSSVDIVFNSGADEGNFGYLSSNSVLFYDSANNLLGNLSFSFSGYQQDTTATVSLTFLSHDIGYFLIESYLYTTGPIVKSITFNA